MAEKKGLIQRFIVGKDRDEHYARSTLPSNRKELLWDIIKGRFWKLVLMNLMLIIAFIPLLLIMLMQSNASLIYGSLLPFSGGLFVGYPYVPDLYQLMFMFEFRMQMQMFLVFVPALMFAGLILAGIFYIIRNLVWSEGVFIANDFWKGFKTNWFHFILITFFLGLAYLMAGMNVSIMNHTQVFSPQSFFAGSFVNNVITGLTYIMAGFVTIMAFFACTITVTYKLKFSQLIKNSFLLTLGLLPRNIIMMALSLSPFLIIFIFGMGGFLAPLLMGLILMLGFSLAILIWSVYSHWVFDMFINDKVEGAEKNRGLYQKMDKQGKPSAKKSYFENPKKKKVKPVTDEEIAITELPTNFSRGDLQKLAKEKDFIKQEGEKWSKEHENDDLDEDIENDTDNSEDNSVYEGYEDAMRLEGYEPESDEEAEDDKNN